MLWEKISKVCPLCEEEEVQEDTDYNKLADMINNKEIKESNISKQEKKYCDILVMQETLSSNCKEKLTKL